MSGRRILMRFRMAGARSSSRRGMRRNALVDELILNECLMKRSVRRVLQAEALAMEEGGWDPHDWSEERRATFQRMQGDKMRAGRGFFRALDAAARLGKEK